MRGTIVNTLAILVGTVIGLVIRKWFSKNSFFEGLSDLVMQGIGLAVVVIGITNALTAENMLLVIISLLIGGIIGHAIGIERRLDNLGKGLQRHLHRGDGPVSQGFVTASLIFCVGSMAIVGSLDAGLNGDYLTLYAKSLLDGITSIVLASTLGIGVAFSALAVLLYQGFITLMSSLLHPFLSVIVVNDMSAIGGILIMGIGITMLGIKKLNIGNLLPAIFIPLLYYPLADLVIYLIK
ncbi:MAG TPA: DUF554 domain-containing protein [Bacillota bacterium]|nr:DUF554 domain-containing protein [Bacillota bacterium]